MSKMSIAVLLVFMLTGCAAAGQLTIYDDGQHEMSIGAASNTPASDLFPDSDGHGLMFQLKRNF